MQAKRQGLTLGTNASKPPAAPQARHNTRVRDVTRPGRYSPGFRCSVTCSTDHAGANTTVLSIGIWRGAFIFCHNYTLSLRTILRLLGIWYAFQYDVAPGTTVVGIGRSTQTLTTIAGSSFRFVGTDGTCQRRNHLRCQKLYLPRRSLRKVHALTQIFRV
jgi:hypothetical protein